MLKSDKLRNSLEQLKKVPAVIGNELSLLSDETGRVMSFFNKKRKSKKGKRYIHDAVVVSAISVFIVFGIGFLWFATVQIPDLASFDQRIVGQSTKIYDKTGQVLLYNLSQNIRRTVVPFEEISQYAKNAAIAIEDVDFYNHKGIKITSMIRALLADITTMEFDQGGSTITQQVVKNSLLTKDKTITRKIKEILLAIKLERNVTKDEILNLYLNEAPYGGTIYGIEEASQAFFATSSKDLSLAQAAYLAAIPQAPSRLSPYGAHKDELEARKNLVLLKMKENSLISDEEYEKAKNETVLFSAQITGGIKAPHFVMFIKQYLEENYSEELINEGGLKVITTLDYELQKKAEEIVKRYALENAVKWNASNSSLVAVDAKTGGILVMVGSRDYFDEEIEGNFNVSTGKRQPGSSFKPFVYAQAFTEGYRPETVLFDLPTQFAGNCPPNNMTSTNGCYAPQNYDGKWRGPITLRNALAGSINIPAVKTLYLAGIQDSINLATKMGITTLTDPDRYGLTLVLGGGEVSLLDMTGAYSVFANSGVKHKTHGIIKIEDKNKNILEEEDYDDPGEEVMPKDTALLISDVLSDNEARTPVFGARSSLYFGDRDVAAKTGTTDDYRDTWVIGYTPQVAVGAWTGNNDNSPIAQQVAGYIVAPMWHEFMNELLKTLPDEKFEPPEQKDLSTLKPVLRGIWQGGIEDGKNEIESNVRSILYWVDKDNPLGPAPKNPWSDPQFSHWQYSIDKWVAEHGISNSGTVGLGDSENYSGSMSVNIKYPTKNAVVLLSQMLPVLIDVLSQNPISKADYFVNGDYIGSSNTSPFGFSFIPRDIDSLRKNNILKVVVSDNKGNTVSDSVSFSTN